VLKLDQDAPSKSKGDKPKATPNAKAKTKAKSKKARVSHFLCACFDHCWMDVCVYVCVRVCVRVFFDSLLVVRTTKMNRSDLFCSDVLCCSALFCCAMICCVVFRAALHVNVWWMGSEQPPVAGGDEDERKQVELSKAKVVDAAPIVFAPYL